MLHFLRSIRRSLIGAGATRKYLLYAIGEILLVMVGILLALQVNNWNEDRIDSLQRDKIITNLKSEYLINLGELGDRINRIDTTTKYIDETIKLMMPDYHLLDEENVTHVVAKSISWFTTYDESSGALQDLLNNNKLGLIKYDSLRISLASWKKYVDNVKERETRCLNILQNHLMPHVYRNFAILKIDYPEDSKLPSDNRKIMADLQFESLLDDYRWNLWILRNQYFSLRTQLNKILRFIEIEQDK
jgi:hypothetical protein